MPCIFWIFSFSVTPLLAQQRWFLQVLHDDFLPFNVTVRDCLCSGLTCLCSGLTCLCSGLTCLCSGLTCLCSGLTYGSRKIPLKYCALLREIIELIRLRSFTGLNKYSILCTEVDKAVNLSKILATVIINRKSTKSLQLRHYSDSIQTRTKHHITCVHHQSNWGTDCKTHTRHTHYSFKCQNHFTLSTESTTCHVQRHNWQKRTTPLSLSLFRATSPRIWTAMGSRPSRRTARPDSARRAVLPGDLGWGRAQLLGWWTSGGIWGGSGPLSRPPRCHSWGTWP